MSTLGATPQARACSAWARPISPPRITSYNVCYTKLLRERRRDALMDDFPPRNADTDLPYCQDGRTVDVWHNRFHEIAIGLIVRPLALSLESGQDGVPSQGFLSYNFV